MNKLHANFQRGKDKEAKNGKNDATKKDDKDAPGQNGEKGRKPNFFERKRFLNYEKNSDTDDEKAD